MSAASSAATLEAQFSRPAWTDRRHLRWYSKLVFLTVLGLVFKGALVTSHDAGLAVPDWPTTFGENMFTYGYSKWVGGIFFEHAHRLYASIVGLLTVILAFWIWFTDDRKIVRYMGLFALGLVMIQGMLGGLTVRMHLPDEVSIAHGVLGQTFLVLTLAIAYSYSFEWSRRDTVPAHPQIAKLIRLACVVLSLIYLQLIIGATVRHTFSGLAIPDFPTMGGSWLPSVSEETLTTINRMRDGIHLAPIGVFNVAVQLMHRGLGIVLLAVILLGWVGARRAGTHLPALVRTTWGTLLILALVQFCLGVSTIWSRREPFTTSFHVVVGAAALSFTALLVMRSVARPRETND